MENLEKIEAYITGKMDAQEMEAFEKGIESDPTLKSEVTMQKAIVEAVKKARMAELKGMLSQVPITGIEATLGISVTKIAAIIVSAGVLVTASVFYFRPDNKPVQSKSIEDSIFEKIEVPAADIPAIQPKEEEPSKIDSASEATPEKKAEKPKVKKISTTNTKVSKPKLDIVDPTKELVNENSASNSEAKESNALVIAASHIPVEMNETDKKHSFHYQFSEGKLMLFGSFDKGLYEVIEVNGNTHSMFLFYKDSYYQLNEKSRKIKPLVTIQDTELVAKLNEFRSR